MQTTQTVILDALEERIESIGLLPTRAFTYANVGNVIVLGPESLDTVCRVALDFQGTYWSGTVFVRETNVGKVQSRTDGRALTNSQAIDTIVGHVHDAMRTELA